MSDDLELFDDAKSDFPSKWDLKDRLVLVWVTGKSGSRKGENGSYDWVDTYTLVIDDGPEWTGKVFDGDKQTNRDPLVVSVADAGPQLLKNFQYSFAGMVARLKPRISADGKPETYKPLLGRINSRPNAKKGMAPPFSIADPTDADKAIARQYADNIREVTEAVKAAVSGASSDDSAFD